MKRHSETGFTLIEMVVVVAVVGIMATIAIPSWNQWFRNQRVINASTSITKAFSLARSEAIRTGNNHIVFFQLDAVGNTLIDADGNAVPIQIVNDQLPGTADQNCEIDTDEILTSIQTEDGLNWGVSNATSAVPSDSGDGDYETGSSFTVTGTSAGADATWVLFNSRGMATAFKPDCTIAASGSGGGAIYITNGKRDYAIVLNPLGSVQTHAWETGAGTWSN